VFPRDTGMIGLAVRERAPVFTPNVLTDPRVVLTPAVRACIEPAPYRAVLAVPIARHHRVIGALGVGDRAGRVFSEEEVRLAQAFADQAAIALENARLFAEQHALLETAKIREARLQALVDVSRQLARIQPLDALFTAVATTCGQLLEADSVGIRLLEGDELVVAGTWGDARGVMVMPRLKIGESVSGMVAATGQPLVISDPAHDPRLVSAHRDALVRLGHVGLLVVPIKPGERVAGVLSVHTRQRGGFTADDLAIVTAFASHVAVALENSRLYAEARRAYDELSQTQGQLVQAQKMEAVGQLAGGIAHDFNNLITVIGGRAEMLLNKMLAGDPLRDDVDAIKATAQRAADLTRQMLAFSRKQVLDPKILDLNRVVTEIAPMLRRLIGEDIELLTVLDVDPGRVKADPRQLEQVLMNLVINARDAMAKGGRLTLETASVMLDADYAREHVGVCPGHHILLAVSDTGEGMDAETQARIFEPFFTTKEPGKGTGLGLATVYGIVKQSGGNICVYSEPERGTTFKIYLPRVDEVPDVVAPERPSSGGQRGSETILLVEDDNAVRHLADDILTAQGYTVIQAAHGGEALVVSARHSGPIDLLLTDVVMPHMSGRVLVERLTPKRPDMRILYMSGYTENAIVHHGVLDAGTVFLPKPFTLDDLVRKVREVLDATARRPASA
jgi:two-component system, cell cycle sensor histidine kinase and response regulator CckA